ncbi:helix-turn-helix domain-containing protein [Sediminitomix flava]|uniref:AraC-like DNA-binding protein n=1 Tax=Sediminitomix flava TaxID=379075 RepID=A0A315Z854_SEDFL|nr:AraC family transcriptional regulator [Sediminitomix flava]PWJ41766.1 AraC-like DNA-binding protein [Sediminitomix flava]
MDESDRLRIETIEHAPKRFYEGLSEKYGGKWDGTRFSGKTNFGEVNAVLLEYPNQMLVSLADYTLQQVVEVVNQPQEGERMVSIRIGFHGSMIGQSQKMGYSEGILVYDANRPFKVLFPANKLIRWMSIQFPLSVIESWMPKENQDVKFLNSLHEEDNWFFYYRLTPEIEALVRDASMYLNNSKLVRPLLYARAFEIIARIMLLVEEDSSKVVISKKIHPDDFDLMYQIKEQLLSDLSQLPNIDVLSTQFNMSSSKLQRSFKAVFELPIIKFYNRHRLEEANRLLKYSNKSIIEISDELGFHSASHLSRKFKGQFGYSPNSLRNDL